MSQQKTYTPEEEQEISERVAEYEEKFGSLDRTTRMLEQLRESHATGVDNLIKLGEHSEQMGRVEKLTNEQEQYVKGLGKYKKFNKYMVRFSKKQKEEKPKPKKNQEIHNEVTRLKVKNEVDIRIFNKRQEDEKDKREKKLKEYNDRQNQLNNNPFSPGDQSPTTTTTTKTTTTSPSSPKSPQLTEDEILEKKSASRKKWKSGDDGVLSKNDKNQLNYAIENQALPINRLSEECVKDNVFVQRSKWIQQQDAQLDEMNDILCDLHNISLATQTELQTQSIKLDDIDASMDRGSDFSLKKKSKKSIEKEQKKKEKEEKDRIKREEKTKQDIDKQVRKDFGGVGISSK